MRNFVKLRLSHKIVSQYVSQSFHDSFWLGKLLSISIWVKVNRKIGPQCLHVWLTKLSCFDREGHKLKDLVSY